FSAQRLIPRVECWPDVLGFAGECAAPEVIGSVCERSPRRECAAILLWADPTDALESCAEGEGAAVADPPRGGPDRRVRVAQEVCGECKSPARQKCHRRLPDKLGKSPRQRRTRHADRFGQR